MLIFIVWKIKLLKKYVYVVFHSVITKGKNLDENSRRVARISRRVRRVCDEGEANRRGSTDGDINHGNNTGRPSKYLSDIHRKSQGLINGCGIRKSFAFCMPAPDAACQIIVEGFFFCSWNDALCIRQSFSIVALSSAPIVRCAFILFFSPPYQPIHVTSYPFRLPDPPISRARPYRNRPAYTFNRMNYGCFTRI